MKNMQALIDEIDRCIRAKEADKLSLPALAAHMGYSKSHFSRRFRAISGMQLREYVRGRTLALSLSEVRDTTRPLLEIAMDFGFSSHEAFTRAFKKAYGVTPSAYRVHPVPVALRTVIKPFDCYLLEAGGGTALAAEDVKTYFVTIPKHKFVYIKNNESIGYWDFWRKQSQIPGQDCETICGLLESIPGKLDDLGAGDLSSGAGQIMAFINDPRGRICSWGIPLVECYGARLPWNFAGEAPGQMLLMDVPEGEYIVFEHGPFDYETQCQSVEEKMEEAMRQFDYAETCYALDLTPGRVFYYYHDPARCWKYVRPVRRR